MEIKIRKAEKVDINNLTRLYTDFYNELRGYQGWRKITPDEIMEDVRRYILKDVIYLAIYQERPIGFIRISERDGAYWLEELYVEPIYRNKGIGSKLVDEAERYIFSRSDSIFIMVLPQHIPAIKFWVERGYTLLNTLELSKHKDMENQKHYRIPFHRFRFEIFKWEKEFYDDIEREYLRTLQKFYEAGYTSRDYIKIVTAALKEFIE